MNSAKAHPTKNGSPGIASQHGCVITQHLQVNRTRAQWHLCKHKKIGVFILKPPKKGWDYWTIVNLVVISWSQIQKITKDDPRPFGYMVDSRGKFYNLE
jgi:hypothetical protein